MIKISNSEKQYIIDGIQQNMRTDGRSRLDYRAFSVETGIVSQTNGSARVKLANNTDVLVGVKVEIGEPDPDFPNQGRLEVKVECSPSASPEFEGRGGEELNAVLSAMLRNLLHNAQTVEWTSLCITPGKQCWIVYVDCLVLDSTGNLFDALAIATRSAIHNTKVPKIEVLQMGNGQTEIEVSDDPSDYTNLTTESVPVSVTLAKVGSRYIVDPTLEEELCMESRMTVAVNAKGNICSIQKGGVSSGINPSELNKMLQSARKIGLVLLKQLDNLLENELEGAPKIGFAR